MHTNINHAIDECGPGHPSHVRSVVKIGDRIGRIVAIRTGNKPKTFSLTFSDPKVDLRPKGDTIYDVQAKDVYSTIARFLYGQRVSDENPWFCQWINQATRDCYVIRKTPTRCRIEYEMPNNRNQQAWRRQVTIGEYTYVSE